MRTMSSNAESEAHNDCILLRKYQYRININYEQHILIFYVHDCTAIIY